MEQNPELLAAHHARWAAFDPLLADSRALADPEAADGVLTYPGGMALVRNVQADPDSWGHTFFATRESKLIPRVDGPRAFAELLDLWAAQDGFRDPAALRGREPAVRAVLEPLRIPAAVHQLDARHRRLRHGETVPVRPVTSPLVRNKRHPWLRCA